jgi:hypothetical protein
MAVPIVNWNSVFSTPRLVRLIDPVSPPNAPLKDEPYDCSRMSRMRTIETMSMATLSAVCIAARSLHEFSPLLRHHACDPQ